MKYLSVTLLAFLSLCVCAHSFACDDPFSAGSSYVGADAQWRNLSLKRHDTQKVKYSLPQGHVYVGYKFNDYFGVEGGSSVSKRRAKETKHQVKLYSGHLGLVGFAPIKEGFDLVGGAGISHVRMSTKHPEWSRRASQTRVCPRLMGGLEMVLVDTMKVRLSTAWEKTSALKKYETKGKDSLIWMAGVQYGF